MHVLTWGPPGDGKASPLDERWTWMYTACVSHTSQRKDMLEWNKTFGHDPRPMNYSQPLVPIRGERGSFPGVCVSEVGPWWTPHLEASGRRESRCSRRTERKQRVSRVEWWCDTLLRWARVPTSLTVCSWAHVALIAASTEPPVWAHTHTTARIKETTAWTLWNFYSVYSLLSPFSSLSSFSYSPPWPPSSSCSFFFIAPPPNRQERLLSAMFFSARLPSCPEALEHLVSSLTANVSPPSARSKNLMVGGDKGDIHTNSRSSVGNVLC